jgi:predicted Zn-dependent peptidase
MKFIKKILPNSLRLITLPMEDNPTVTVLVLVEAGSRYETKEINGISHFLEHMCFKGTVRRGRSLDIARELDAIGAHYNAFTAQEFTGYFAKADFRHFEKILDVVSDIYLHPTLPAEEIEKEKKVIVEEIRMYRDLPQKHVQDLFVELLYGDQPAGWNIAGTEQVVSSFTREKIYAYRQNHYVASATVVVVAGNVDESVAADLVEKKFQQINLGSGGMRSTVIEKQNKPELKILDKPTDQTHLVLGFRAFAENDQRAPALRVLANILGGGMSSRLFQKVREEMGAGYYLNAGAELSSDHGFFAVSTGVESRRRREVVSAVLIELDKIRSARPPEEELRKAKDNLAGNLYLSLETSDSLADYYGFQEVTRMKIKTPEEWVKEIEVVSAEEVRRVAAEIFTNENLNLAMIGAGLDKDEVDALRDILYI